MEKVEAHQGYLGLGFVVGRYDEIKKTIVARILADGLLQPYLFFTVRNMEPSQRSEVEALIQDTLLQVRQEGLDREQLEALLCQQEFVFKECDFGGYPSGIINAINVMESWLYGGNPVLLLSQSRYFDEIRREILDGSFEEYLDDLILKNEHRVSVLMVSDENCLEEERKKEREKLESFSASLSRELANLAKQILVGEDMFVSVTAEGKPKVCTESWKAVFLETGEMPVPVQKEEDAESAEKQIVGISIPAPVSFAAMAAKLNQAGIHNTGSFSAGISGGM